MDFFIVYLINKLHSDPNYLGAASEQVVYNSIGVDLNELVLIFGIV
jgi:hypothetical protein